MKIGQVCQWWNNGSNDRATMGIDRRKIEGGWPREFAEHARAAGASHGYTKRIIHLPFGTRDENNMEIDAFAWAKAIPGMELATNEAELVACVVMQWEIDGVPTDIYFGGARGSEILNNAWSGPKKNRTNWNNRIRSVFRPLVKMKERGVDVGFVIDGCAPQPAGGPDQAALEIGRSLGLRPGVEALPEQEWCNQADIGVVSFNSYWKMAEPSVNKGSKVIPYGKLKGPITIICVEDDPDSEVIAHLAAGRDVAPLGHRPEPGELRARALKLATASAGSDVGTGTGKSTGKSTD